MNPKEMPERLQALLVRLLRAKLITDDERLTLAQARQTADRLAKAEATKGRGEMSVTSLVSHATGEGRLDVVWHGVIKQLSPQEARSTAWVLIEAASVAEAEAALMRFLKAEVGLPEEKAAIMLAHFRDYRDADPQSLVSTSETKQ
jgi:hypothetical protein